MEKASSEPKEPHRLSEIIVREVSIVDSPANMRKFVLIKANGHGMAGDSERHPFYADGFIYPEGMTVAEMIDLRKSVLEYAVDNLNEDDQQAFIGGIEKRDMELSYHLLPIAEKYQAQQVEQNLPLLEIAAILKRIRAAMDAMTPAERLDFAAHPEDYELTEEVLHKEAPAAEPAKPAEPLQIELTLAPIPVSVTQPNGEKSVEFIRDTAGMIISAKIVGGGQEVKINTGK